MAITAVCYYGGWWLPGPVLGLHTPNRAALLVHSVATILSVASVALAWAYFSSAKEEISKG